MREKKRKTSVRKPIWRTHAPVHTHTQFAKNKTGCCDGRRKKSEGKSEKFKCEDTLLFCIFLSVPYFIRYIIAIAVIIDVDRSRRSRLYCQNFFLAQLSTHSASVVFVCVLLFLNDFFITTYGLHDLVQS